MKLRKAVILVVVFVVGAAVGAFARGKNPLDASLFKGKDKKAAAKALLEVAKTQAGKGSWENIGVGRVYYLGGMKAEGQKIFDDVTSAKKQNGGDWIRIARVYYEAGEWDKAKGAFDKALQLEPKDGPWLAEIGASYNLKGDRAKAEEFFVRSMEADGGEVWQTVNMAGSYLGIEPMR